MREVYYLDNKMTEQEFDDALLEDFADFFEVEIINEGGNLVCEKCKTAIEGDRFITVDDNNYCFDCFLSMDFEDFVNEFELHINDECSKWDNDCYDADFLLS